MGMSDRLNNLAGGMKSSVKTGGLKSLVLVFRILTAFFIGLTLSLVGQEAAGYGILSFLFVNLIVFFTFFKITQRWSLGQILIFDLVMVLVAQLLRMYIVLAP